MFEVGTAEIALLVSALACGAALSGAFRNSKKDTSDDAAESAVVVTKLDFIGNDLKDLKAEYRATRNEVKEAHDLAERARERANEAYEHADAAHRRLDRTKIDIQE